MIPIVCLPEALELPVRVTPRGGKNAVLAFEESDVWVRIKVASPPEDGKANAAVVELFAKQLSVAKSNISIVNGETSRNTRLRIASPHPMALLKILAAAMDTSPEICFSGCPAE